MAWDATYFGRRSAEFLRQALMEPRPITIYQDEAEITAKVVLRGAARGILIGGSLCMIARAIGWACPNLADAILFLEAVDTPIGAIDATLTQLRRAGYTNGLKGVAVGQFIRSAERKPGIWSVIDVLVRSLLGMGRTSAGRIAGWARSESAYDSSWNDGNSRYGSPHSDHRARYLLSVNMEIRIAGAKYAGE